MMKRRIGPPIALAVGLAASAAALTPAPARGDCRIARVQFTPEAGMQIAIWIEDTQGNFVTTLYITEATGSYGLGNRPGHMDLPSGIAWPYGHRDGVLPVWAHATGDSYPAVVFQDGQEDWLSHALDVSSPDVYYCRPTFPSEIDVGTCPSPQNTGTDKGKLDPGKTSVYPPRNDIDSLYHLGDTQTDHDTALQFRDLNQLDAVSRATPAGGSPFELLTAIDPALPAGDYVLWVEVSHEFDFNDTYNPDTYPTPAQYPQNNYGIAYRGQPSVVWKMPFSLSDQTASFTTKDYAGYGDPNGVDGELNLPDGTIEDVAGVYQYDPDGIGPMGPMAFPSLGQARLQLLSDGGTSYRIRLRLEPSSDGTVPGAPASVNLVTVAHDAATLTFTAPGDDGDTGTATQYEVRYSAGAPLTEANFETGTLYSGALPPMPAGATIMVSLSGLSPETHYSVGVRAKDECLQNGAIKFLEFDTLAAEGGEVDSCFVATAAFGSLMEPHVGTLRSVRDRVLRKQVLGELFVEVYYTFGPAFAEVIEPSQDLRRLARSGLSPLVDFAESLL
jgi:hypothetical protein